MSHVPPPPREETSQPSLSIAKFFSILAHPQRLDILRLLHQGDATADQLHKSLTITPHRLSQHLTILLHQQLIHDHQAGRRVTYRLLYPELLDWMDQAKAFLPSELPRNIWKK